MSKSIYLQKIFVTDFTFLNMSDVCTLNVLQYNKTNTYVITFRVKNAWTYLFNIAYSSEVWMCKLNQLIVFQVWNKS